MTLEKAIKVLQNLVIHHHDSVMHDPEEALKIGIEALKRELWNRLHPSYPDKGLLPGETEEGK